MIILFGAWCNWFIRGGGYKQLFKDGIEPIDIPSKIVNALFFGLAAAISHKELSATAYPTLMLIAMLIGQAPAIFGEYVDYAAYTKNKPRWALFVALRGIVWLLPIAAVQAYFIGLESLYFAFVGILMAACYWPLYWVKPFGNKWINNWTVSEMLFGACIWSCLVV